MDIVDILAAHNDFGPEEIEGGAHWEKDAISDGFSAASLIVIHEMDTLIDLSCGSARHSNGFSLAWMFNFGARTIQTGQKRLRSEILEARQRAMEAAADIIEMQPALAHEIARHSTLYFLFVGAETWRRFEGRANVIWTERCVFTCFIGSFCVHHSTKIYKSGRT